MPDDPKMNDNSPLFELLARFELPPDTLANLRTPVFAKPLYEHPDTQTERTLHLLRAEYLARSGRAGEIDPVWVAEAAEQARAGHDCGVARLLRVVCEYAMLRAPTPDSRSDADFAIDQIDNDSDTVFNLQRDLIVKEVAVPIRLTLMPTDSGMLPFAGIQGLVGRRFSIAGKTKQRSESI
jgi:hypothetical protein